MSKHSKSVWKNKVTWIVIALVSIVLIGGTVLFFVLSVNKTKEVGSENTTGQNEDKDKNIKDISIGEILNAIDDVNKEQGKQEENINAKELIRIKSIITSQPNIAGGVDLDIKWTNMSDNVIKYITFTAYPVNAVGDIVECTIRTSYKGQFKGQQTGPIKKGEGSKNGYVFENAWYNNTIVKATLMQVDIEYMDGTKISLTGTNLDKTIY